MSEPDPVPDADKAEPKPDVPAAEPTTASKADAAVPNAKPASPDPENAEQKAAPPAAGAKSDAKAARNAPDPKALALTKPDSNKEADLKPGAKAAAPGTVVLKPDAQVPKAKPEYRNNIIFGLAILGLIGALIAAYLFGVQRKPQPPVFAPVSSPYDSAIFANGIIESDQSSGSNINIYPEVSGPVTKVFVHEGQEVAAGAPLFTIDDSIQRANTEELRLQAEASLSVLNELKAEPRLETLAVSEAQVGQAESNLKAAKDQYDKDRASFDIDPKSISRDVLDTAENAMKQAASGLDVARKQYELTKAGAWSYDIANQEKQYGALLQAYEAAKALLAKFNVKAPIDGVVLSVYAAVGSYVSSQGAFDPYTQAFDQPVIMSPPQEYLAVRCYVDEILVSRLPTKWHMEATMSPTGTELKVPLEFVRVQPYVSPKIELSNERQERVDLRVLPVIFRFQKQDLPVYPGQLVDVYIGTKK
jgi:HlyD family secretion protein